MIRAARWARDEASDDPSTTFYGDQGNGFRDDAAQ